MIDICLLGLLAATAMAIVRQHNLLSVILLFSIYSFLGAGWMLVLDAPDVAFTEAAVGAGISTVLMLWAMSLTSRAERPASRRSPWPLLVVLVTGGLLIYGTLDMPRYGDAEAPAHQHLMPQFMTDNVPTAGGEVVKPHIQNIVTTILASYRGYDTLGETTVILTAAIAVLLLLGSRIEDREERLR